MPKTLIPGFTINQMQLYSGLYTILFSGVRDLDKANVVIKLLKNEHPSPDEISRFKHEYEIAKELEAENDIVQVASLEKHDNNYAIVMENINAPTLGEILEKEKKLKLEEFLDLAIQMTQAIGHIHQHSIIHKDINPSNIMCNYSKKEIKIIDFGLSANLPKEHAEIVNPNVLEGTLTYLSPEQTGRMNRGIDYRTDYYSLGVTFYLMLTGELPFMSNDPMELVHYHIAVIPKAPNELDKAIPQIVSDIVMKLLAKKAEDRYQNANGLLADLKECQRQLSTTGSIKPFALGRQDIFSRFQIPEKLYGRENEIAILLNAYDEVTKANVGLMLVSGYSGIGKSALVHEVHKPIVKKHGYFISGKYDQFKHNIPYAAITSAFDGFVKQILTESEDTIAFFRQKIIDAVGENGKIITNVIPNLATIIGEQPDVPELGPTESLNRFSYVIQNFIQALASSDHPLVIFLDDLQWADLPSLKMLETLLNSIDCRYLLIIGAYRSNEVSSAHPLMASLEEIKKHNIKYETIELGPLSLKSVNELISDTTHQQTNTSQELAEICYEKTRGNPFFLIQLLLSLYKDQTIKFDTIKNQWSWDLKKIQEKNITDNVVKLMINKINELKPATQKIMQFAACIGNQFNLDLLSKIINKEPETILIEIQEALKEGYILSHGDAYRAVSYHFAHDRIQQAAYSLLNENEKKLIHINLARLLIQRTSEEKLNEVIFDIANHYNIGIDTDIPSIIDSSERRQIAEINFKASKAAKSAAAFEPALKYIEYGLKCLDKDAWNDNYNSIFDFHVEATENAFLSSKFDTMEKYADTALKQAKNIYDELKIIQIKVMSRIVQVKQHEALNIAFDALDRLGIKFKRQPKTIHVVLQVFKLKYYLIGKSTKDLLNLPEVKDENKKAIMNLLNAISSAALEVDPNLAPLLACYMVIFSIKNGNTPPSAFGYACYGLILCGVLNDMEAGNQFGELASDLVEKMDAKHIRTKVNEVNYIFIKHWRNPLRESIQKALDSFEYGLEMGDLEFACYCNVAYFFNSFLSGVSLKDLVSKIEKYEIRVKNVKQMTAYIYLLIYHQTMLNLLNKQDNPNLLISSTFDETSLLAGSKDKLGLSFLFCNKLQLAYLFEKYSEAIEYIKSGALYLDAALSFPVIPQYYFYKALTLLAIYSSSSPKEQRRLLKETKQCQKKMKLWAKFGPSNYLHKYLLIQAELNRVLGKSEEAIKMYEEAISFANKHEFLQEEALANELTAKFYLSHGKEKIARVYMQDARHCYLLWGADAKVAMLDDKYNDLIGRLGDDHYISSTVSTAASDRSVSQVLDMSTIQKSSQTISSTIVLEDLLKRLMHIVIENAGAERSYLLIQKKGRYLIEAEGSINQDNTKVLQSIEMNSDILPVSLINYVIRTKESVVLDDAHASDQFMNDPYIVNHKPKSILCMPLLNQGKLTGILYMENNLTEGAFTKDRIKVLNLLSSQIAISIDNARLYSNTKDLNEQLIVLNKAYERFVPEDFLSLLEKKSITDVELGDQVQEKMSVLFTDIRNFTTLSETMSPEDNFRFINSFLSVMAPVIKKHNGFVDKYIGDAIMALYPRSADDAIQCALDMQAALKQYNQSRTEHNLMPIGIGIGINTGLLMLGTVGEKHRMNATVISDAVNIASRIESLTKIYQSPILISEDTYRNLKNPARYQIKLVDDKVLVKGKTKPISVYKVEDL